MRCRRVAGDAYIGQRIALVVGCLVAEIGEIIRIRRQVIIVKDVIFILQRELAALGVFICKDLNVGKVLALCKSARALGLAIGHKDTAHLIVIGVFIEVHGVVMSEFGKSRKALVNTSVAVSDHNVCLNGSARGFILREIHRVPFLALPGIEVCGPSILEFNRLVQNELAVARVILHVIVHMHRDLGIIGMMLTPPFYDPGNEEIDRKRSRGDHNHNAQRCKNNARDTRHNGRRGNHRARQHRANASHKKLRAKNADTESNQAAGRNKAGHDQSRFRGAVTVVIQIPLVLRFRNRAVGIVGDTHRGKEKIGIHARPERAGFATVGDLIDLADVAVVNLLVHRGGEDHRQRAAKAHHRVLCRRQYLNNAEKILFPKISIDQKVRKKRSVAKGILLQRDMRHLIKDLNTRVGNVGILRRGGGIYGRSLLIIAGNEKLARRLSEGIVVYGAVNVIEIREMLPENAGLIPVSDSLSDLIRILDLRESIQPGVPLLALHRHRQRSEDHGENVAVHVEHQLYVKLIGGISIEYIIRKALAVCLIHRQNTERAVSRLCAVRALLVVFFKHVDRQNQIVRDRADGFINIADLILIAGVSIAAIHIHHLDVCDGLVGIGCNGIRKVHLVNVVNVLRALIQILFKKRISLGNVCFSLIYAFGVDELDVTYVLLFVCLCEYGQNAGGQQNDGEKHT